jgi:nucleoside-diphosphate-sugar epimerase
VKRLLITGKNGYIASRFAEYMERFSESYSTVSISLQNGDWTLEDFSGYDAIIHTAGIAHVRETPQNTALYYEVNCDLAEAIAEKARSEGVRHFVLLSSGSVYGLTEGIITKDTQPRPVTSYGRSKLQGEIAVTALKTADFRIAILRPLMVYGEGCKGNYQTLVKLAGILPVLPDYQNRRSLVSIETLCAYMKDIIDKEAEGIFFPQEKAPLCTCEMIREIAEMRGRSLKCVKLLNPAVGILRRTTTVGKKAFGDLIYQNLEELPLNG